MDIRRFFVKAVWLCLICFNFGAKAQQPTSSPLDQSWVLTNTQGMTFFRPEMMYSGQLNFPEIPEASKINTQSLNDIGDQMKKILHFMQGNGIALGLGVNSNRDSFFDLYAPFVDILLDEPAAQFGMTLESEVGKMHFLTHDSVHLYMGMPGPRLKDLENREVSKERLKRSLMRIEALASAWTSANHVRWYWEWRRDNQGHPLTSEFKQYNQGLRSIGEFSNPDYTELLEAYMSGRYWDMKKIYSKSINFEVFQKAREAGVPMLFPDFRSSLTPAGEKFLVKHLFPYVLPLVHMTDPKFGFTNLWKYSDLQAEFYLTDWYVRWTEAFQVGEPLDALEKSLERKSELLKQGKMFGDVLAPRPGQFELMYLRNNLAQFGRKVIELETLAERENLNLSEQRTQAIQEILKRSIKLNNEILETAQRPGPISLEYIENRNRVFKQLRAYADQTLPIMEIIPAYKRLPHANYNNFWGDSFAVLMPRPEGLTKFLSAKGIWEVARKQRLERLKVTSRGQQPRPIDFATPPVVLADLEKQLAGLYNLNRSAKPREDQKLHENYYLNRLMNYSEAVSMQVHDVFLPQIYEFAQLTADQKKYMTQVGQDFVRQFDHKMNNFIKDYEKLFINYERDAEAMTRIASTESDLKWAVDRTLNEMAEILDTLQVGKEYSRIEKSVSKIRVISEQLRSGSSVSRGVNDILRNLMPYKKGTLSTACSLITRLCLTREPLSRYLETVSRKTLTGSSDKKVKIVYVDSSGREAAKPSLPDNAVVLMALNHDHALLDLNTMKELEKALNFEASSVLTNIDVWPMYKIIENRDESILFRQNKDLKSRVVNLAQKTKGRYMFAIYPEGDLSYFGAQFPMLSHIGAFNIARSLANKFEKDRPVFLMKGFGNFLKAVTSKNEVEFRIEVTIPERVPTHALGGRDAWIENQRQAFEKESNERRGRQMTDLIYRDKDPAKRTRNASEVSAYRTTSDFMQKQLDVSKRTDIAISCQKMVGGE